ncbi:uncharacterized protein FSUBG_10442 [Fusarium subglutinans]|uniref:Uncharacterized protein n=1 Tax=Gibberella subglutinans TaxID=42677 RepID=A0A8H5P7M6_GIBSU|nr:uncharacterized protein FSUBG_10442 [Fusarium subglutinans]KAF5591516.1 hypothetical protein FSUBG_10442 [Fusarium subglutinans]
MARSIALAALLFALPIAAQPEITSSSAATAATSPMTTDIISDSPESTEHESLTIVSTITRSNGIDYYAVPISKYNGTVTGSAPSATVDVSNGGAGLMIGTVGIVAGVVGALAVVL